MRKKTTSEEISEIIKAHVGGNERAVEKATREILAVFGRMFEEKGRDLVSIGQIMQRK